MFMYQYAVIALAWHQYIVSKDMEIETDRYNDVAVWDTFEIDTVLGLFDEEWTKTEFGSPYLNKTKVLIEKKRDFKGKKMKITKFKRKNRYDKVMWFRSWRSVLYIKDIIIDDQ